jgi:hypothetical protein
VPAEPTPNETEPTAGPVITAGDYTGDYLRIGISNFGEILPFEYPDGSEHLAVLNYLSGYTVAYEADGSDHVALSGIGSRIGIVPISYREITNSTALLVAEAVTRTQDARLQITRRFTFMKSEKAVQVRTTLHDLTAAGLRRVVFKEWADWDVDGNDQNIWDYDRVRNMVYARRFRFAGIAGLEAPAFMDVNGWNDYGRRATTVEVPSGPYAGDGIEVLHYELGDLGPLQSRAVVTGYGVGDDLGELQRVVDRVLVSGS